MVEILSRFRHLLCPDRTSCVSGQSCAAEWGCGGSYSSHISAIPFLHSTDMLDFSRMITLIVLDYLNFLTK